MENSVEYILRVKVPLSATPAIEDGLKLVAKELGGQLSRIEREERGTYSLHKSRKMLVRS